MKIGAHPGILVFQMLRQGTDSYFPVDQHGDAVADREQRVQIVRDEEHGQPEAGLQIADQPVELGSGDRIEAGGRLVEKQDLGIERQRPREPGPLAHSARQLRRELLGGPFGQADQRDLAGRDLVHQRLRHRTVLAQRHLDVLHDGQRAEQRAVLEQHAPALFERAQLGLVGVQHVAPQHLDAAALRPPQPDNRAQQHRLAGAGAADDAEHLAAPHIEVEAVMDGLAAETGHQTAHPDHDIVIASLAPFGIEVTGIVISAASKTAPKRRRRRQSRGISIQRPTASSTGRRSRRCPTR